jgi:hypothetical protein
LTKKKKDNQVITKKIGNFLILILFCCFSSLAFAQTQVSATVDSSQLGIGEAVNLTIRIKSDEDFDLPLPELPRIAGLEEINSAVGSRQSSSSAQFGGGGGARFSTTIVQDYNYVLSPQKEGVFIIPVIDLVVNGKTYKTQPVKIEVKEEFRNGGGQKPARRGGQFPPGFGEEDNGSNPFGAADNAEDLFEQMLRQQQKMFGGGGAGGGNPSGQDPSQGMLSQNLDVNAARDNFFVYLDVDKTEVYEGEQITANWYIYVKSGLESLDRVKFPDLKGFWKEIIEEVPALQFTQVMVNGVPFRRALLASHALFPIKSGPAIIDEFKIKAKLRPTAQFGWGKPFDVTKVSKRTAIKVLPLPEEGKTISFSGAVGNYRVSLKTEGNSYPANQPFSIQIRYEGVGNAKLIDLPQIQWPEGLEVYDTKSEAKFFKEGNSYKEFEVLVIPRKEGEMKIPAIEFTYFDPSQKKYVSEKSEEIILQITPGQAGTNISLPATGTGNAGVAGTHFVAQPILQLPEAGVALTQFRLWIYLFILIAGVLSLFAVTFKKNRQFKVGNQVLEAIVKKLDLVQTHHKNKDVRKIGSEATNLIYLIVAQLAGVKKADQEIHVLIKEIPLKDQHLYLERINSLFDYFQLLGFSPDEIMQNAIDKKPIEMQLQEIKKLTHEIVDKLKKEDKNNT